MGRVWPPVAMDTTHSPLPLCIFVFEGDEGVCGQPFPCGVVETSELCEVPGSECKVGG